LQWKVASEHSHPRAIGVVDESGNPKKGNHTCGVKRQWCGNTGKIDNCVVAVHLGYVADDFQCLLDSDLYLPMDWTNDPVRRKQARIPQTVIYRKKTDIALDQIRCALGNGIRFLALTFDEFYGRDRDFLDGLESLGQNYVGEIPSDFSGWTSMPDILQKATPSEMRKRGRKRIFPRISRQMSQASDIRKLGIYSPKFYRQKWQKFKIKDGEKVKAIEFYRKCGKDGLPGRTHTLIIARNVLAENEVKYFLSNMVIDDKQITLEWLLWVAFSRWPIERCFEIGKSDLGMDNFEMRNWQGIHRHFYITQLLREKKCGQFIPDGRTDSASRSLLDYGSIYGGVCTSALLSKDFGNNNLLSSSQSVCQKISSQENFETLEKTRNKCQRPEELCAL
jgi:SRSO17 transposase